MHSCASSPLAATRLRVVPAHISHVYVLAANLRTGDAAEIEAVGLAAKPTIRTSFRHAVLCRTALIDNEVAAMWGLGGTLLSGVGAPWLLTTPVVERVSPLTFVRVGAREMAAMLRVRRRLENQVHASYARAIGVLRLWGFTLDEPKPLGPKNELFCRFWRER